MQTKGEPTSTEQQRVEEIAKGLTKAQHTALWNLNLPGWQRAPHDGWRRSGQACSSLCRVGLAEQSVEDCGVFYRLTPLGAAVRAHLQGQAS